MRQEILQMPRCYFLDGKSFTVCAGVTDSAGEYLRGRLEHRPNIPNQDHYVALCYFEPDAKLIVEASGPCDDAWRDNTEAA